MSETAPEAPAPRRESRGFMSTFTTRIGPLPMWVWLVIVAGILIAWRVYSSKASAQQQADTTDTGVPADQVPQFVNQTYTTVTPPVAPVPNVNITTPPGPPGPPGVPGPNVVIPNVAGLKGSQAYQVLRSQALDPGPGGVNPNRIVVRTNPPAGKRVPKHTSVTVIFK